MKFNVMEIQVNRKTNKFYSYIEVLNRLKPFLMSSLIRNLICLPFFTKNSQLITELAMYLLFICSYCFHNSLLYHRFVVTNRFILTISYMKSGNIKLNANLSFTYSVNSCDLDQILTN